MARSLACTTKRLGLALGMLGLAACGSVTTEDTGRTSAAMSAANSDPSTQAYMVYEASDPLHVPFEIFISKSRVYRFTCDNDTDLARLETATGATPPNATSPNVITDPALGLGPVLGKDPATVTIADFMPIPCKPLPKERLYYTVDAAPDAGADGSADGGAAGGRRYYVLLQDVDHPESNGSATILHNVGCGELLDAMGFDESGFPVYQRDATFLDPQLYELFARDDAYDINCQNRTNPNAYVPHLSVQPDWLLSQDVKRGIAISPVQFKLVDVRPEAVATLVSTNNDCGFLTASGLTVQGIVPADFQRARCAGSYFVRGAGQGPTFETAPLTVSLQIGCKPGADDCDRSGNCTQLDTMTQCGSCNTACVTPANASATCSTGVCQPTCLLGFDDCNHSMTDGCETPLNTPFNCGHCSVACPSDPNGTPVCTSGVCALKCNSGYAASNGSCQPLIQCGVTPGLCAQGASCTQQGANHTCACPPGNIGDPNNPKDYCHCSSCTEGGVSCGPFTDSCGHSITCGGCDSQSACLGGQCTHCKTCGEYGLSCGGTTNNCGQSLNCGGCDSQSICSGGSCVHCNTCADYGDNCGVRSNNCGNTLYCGGCASGQDCRANKCVKHCYSCEEMGLECGTTNCGQSCGRCGSGSVCTAGTCEVSGPCKQKPWLPVCQTP